jgi:exodeoxyribonuclease VII small subunit
MPKQAQSPEPLSFESALGELEAIVQNMESGKLSLDDSLAAYQRGMQLLKFCQETLASAEQQIRVLEEGSLREFPVEGAENA